jgi:hypothetical protein
VTTEKMTWRIRDDRKDDLEQRRREVWSGSEDFRKGRMHLSKSETRPRWVITREKTANYFYN